MLGFEKKPARLRGSRVLPILSEDGYASAFLGACASFLIIFVSFTGGVDAPGRPSVNEECVRMSAVFVNLAAGEGVILGSDVSGV